MHSTADDEPSTRPRRRHGPLFRAIQIALSVAVVLAIFGLILPKIASYADVWKTITHLTWLELATLIAATIFNLFTYWWQMMAAMPGLSLWQAAVNNQSSTTIANILPGGGVIALGLTYAMFYSWGFTGSAIALLISTTGIWNSFMKLGLPVIAVVVLAIAGQATTTLLIPALIGLAILVGSIILFALVLWKKELAQRIGEWLGRVSASMPRGDITRMSPSICSRWR